MRTIAHLSDLHFGRTDPSVVDALVADLTARQADLIVISGDLTQRARSGEFVQAADFIARLPSPPLVVPGNHDLPLTNFTRRIFSPYARFRRTIERNPFPTFEDAGLRVIGVDTTRVAGMYFDWSRGRISRSQIDMVSSFFAAPRLPGETRVVVTHHPFLFPPGDESRDLVGRGELALEAFRNCGVDLLLSGHFHKSYSGHVAMRHRTKHRILVVQASTSTSTRRKGEPNAYNWIACTGGRQQVLQRAWDPEKGTFADGETIRYGDL